MAKQAYLNDVEAQIALLNEGRPLEAFDQFFLQRV
jgi:hypothetical protein